MDEVVCEREDCIYYLEDEEFFDDPKHPVSNCKFDQFVNYDPSRPCAYFRLDWKKARKSRD